MDSATDTAPTHAALAELVRAALRDRYEHPVVVAHGLGVAVLAGAPLELARAAVGEQLASRVTALDVVSLPWFSVPDEGLRLWRQHGRSGSEGELVSEVEAGDPPLQVVVEEGEWQLVRLADGAQGWIERRILVPASPFVVATSARIDIDAFLDELESFEGVAYVWGGTTDRGVDCSGIVQRAAWRASRTTWLPRHSRELLRVGERVAPSRPARGDVLILERDPATYAGERRAQLEALAEVERRTGSVPSHGPAIHPMHVAVAVSATEAIHASRDAMRVVREPIASLRERYRVLGVRRLTHPAAASDS